MILSAWGVGVLRRADDRFPEAPAGGPEEPCAELGVLPYGALRFVDFPADGFIVRFREIGMGIGMVADLVPGPDLFFDQLRPALGVFADQKERSLHAVLIEDR